jgi:hypothetical protein
MALVEARWPDGRINELTEVNLTNSGLLIMITDHDGNQVLIHRLAWQGVVDAVSRLLGESLTGEERQDGKS